MSFEPCSDLAATESLLAMELLRLVHQSAHDQITATVAATGIEPALPECRANTHSTWTLSVISEKFLKLLLKPYMSLM